MPAAVTFNLLAAVTLGTQFLIFVYLYRSHRVPFFRYLVWAWGAFVGSKSLEAARAFTPGVPGLAGAGTELGITGDLLILAAAFAFRSGYRIRPAHAAIGLGYALFVGVYGPLVRVGHGGEGYVTISGLALIVAGLAFWPRRQPSSSAAGQRLLAVSLALWGLHRGATAYFGVTSDMGFAAVSVSFVLIYYLVVFGIVIVVLDRARAEAATLKEFNERLIDGLGEGLQLVDETFAVQHTNRWLVEHLGVKPGHRCYDALNADARPCPGCPLVAGEEDRATQPRATQPRASETGHPRPDPSWRSDTTDLTPRTVSVTGPGARRFQLTCSPVHQPDGRVLLLELVADVTERERMRSRLAEAERLASVGELAAGVAHEIRNPLAAIVNATALLDGEATLPGDERAAAIGFVRKEARRLNALLSDFLRFARPGEPKRVESDLGDVVAHVAALAGEQQARTPGLAVETRVDPEVPRFAFDPDQLTQALWNVALNAIEAMAGDGRLSIHGARVGAAVVIDVDDTGPGIAPEDVSRIFEPFYSRRAGGTGLGLPIARRIVTAHGGRIDVESAVGAGTRVRIRLPLG